MKAPRTEPLHHAPVSTEPDAADDDVELHVEAAKVRDPSMDTLLEGFDSRVEQVAVEPRRAPPRSAAPPSSGRADPTNPLVDPPVLISRSVVADSRRLSQLREAAERMPPAPREATVVLPGREPPSQKLPWMMLSAAVVVLIGVGGLALYYRSLRAPADPPVVTAGKEVVRAAPALAATGVVPVATAAPTASAPPPSVAPASSASAAAARKNPGRKGSELPGFD